MCTGTYKDGSDRSAEKLLSACDSVKRLGSALYLSGVGLSLYCIPWDGVRSTLHLVPFSLKTIARLWGASREGRGGQCQHAEFLKFRV